MKNATLHCMVRMPNDTRDTASSTVSAVCKQSDALRFARDIEENAGAFARLVESGAITVATTGFATSGGRVVPGHGTVIDYASGKRRTVRANS